MFSNKPKETLAARQIRQKRLVSNKLEIIWPETPQQQVKDYAVITTEEELEEYLNRCKDTGFCF